MPLFWGCWLLLVLSTQVIGAPNCSDSRGYYVISNQQELDSTFEHCTTIESTIYIGTNYTGPFVLPDIVTSVASIETNDSSNTYYGRNHFLTTVVGNGVESLGNLSITSARKLESVTFRKLQSAGYLSFYEVGKADLDFPSLVSLDDGLYVNGGSIESLHFPLLTGKLSGLGFVVRWFHIATKPPKLNVSFPALEEASIIRLEGNFSSIYMPQLSTLTGTASELSPLSIYQNAERAFKVDRIDLNPVDISLPNLEKIEGIYLSGGLKSVSFASLVEVSNFQLYADSPIDLILEPLESVEKLDVRGEILGVSLPSLRHITRMQISSDIRPEVLDCSNASSAWDNSSHSDSPDRYYSCYGMIPDPPEPKPKSTLGRTLGISLGVGIPAVVALVLAIYFSRKSAKARAARLTNPPKYEMEPLPEYSPPGSQMSETQPGGERSVETGVGQGDRNAPGRE